VSDAHIQNLTKLSGLHSLHLAQHKDLTLIGRQAFHAPLNQFPELLRQKEAFEVGGRALPVATLIEAGLKYLVNGIGLMIPDRSPAVLLRLAVQDAKEPGAELRAPLELIEAFEKRGEHILREVLGCGFVKPKRPRSPEQWAGVFADGFGESVGIAASQPIQEGWAHW
jgi:hypothetical protein